MPKRRWDSHRASPRTSASILAAVGAVEGDVQRTAAKGSTVREEGAEV